MDDVTMLQTLSEYGEDAGTDYNDAEEVMGWFGWSIDDDHILTVTFRDDNDNEDKARWKLVRA